MLEGSANAIPLTNPVIEAYLKDLDLTPIRENLKLTAEQRTLKLQSYLRLVEELKTAPKFKTPQPGEVEIA